MSTLAMVRVGNSFNHRFTTILKIALIITMGNYYRIANFLKLKMVNETKTINFIFSLFSKYNHN